MKIHTKEFRVTGGRRVRLAGRPTRVKPFYRSTKQYLKILDDHRDRMTKLQDLLYASNEYALLVIFQAMDAAGKDGAIKHVMSGVNPQGCQVFSFKHPSAQELSHDFLWRTTRCLPERGRIGIFNRSYYEEVLIARVHPEILRGEGLPDEEADSAKLWRHRFRSILDLERHLHANGTRVVKFFLHLSKEEQRRRFLARIDDPHKNWKISRADIVERGYWDQYRGAYEECLARTSTKDSPWYAVPADDKANAHLIISKVIVETLEKLKLAYPRTGKGQHRELVHVRKLLEK
jgi:PPK2 family polyphosphate:nucleotide phosphotransferase